MLLPLVLLAAIAVILGVLPNPLIVGICQASWLPGLVVQKRGESI